MTRDYKVVPASEIKPDYAPRKSPMKIILESVDGDYWTMNDVAKHIGVHVETIRRATKELDEDGNQMLKAPSNAVRSGRVVIWLFDRTDVEEVENHFAKRGFRLDRVDPEKTLAEQKTW